MGQHVETRTGINHEFYFDPIKMNKSEISFISASETASVGLLSNLHFGHIVRATALVL